MDGFQVDLQLDKSIGNPVMEYPKMGYAVALTLGWQCISRIKSGLVLKLLGAGGEAQSSSSKLDTFKRESGVQ